MRKSRSARESTVSSERISISRRTASPLPSDRRLMRCSVVRMRMHPEKPAQRDTDGNGRCESGPDTHGGFLPCCLFTARCRARKPVETLTTKSHRTDAEKRPNKKISPQRHREKLQNWKRFCPNKPSASLRLCGNPLELPQRLCGNTFHLDFYRSSIVSRGRMIVCVWPLTSTSAARGRAL